MRITCLSLLFALGCGPTTVSIDDDPSPDTGPVDTDDTQVDTDDTDDTDVPIEPPPAPTAAGPYTAVFTNATVRIDGRDVPTILAAPGDLQGIAPIVLFNHGFSTDPSEYRDTAERLATHGYFVALPEWDSSAWSSRTHLELAEDAVAMIDWLLAQNAAPNSPLSGKLDPAQIGLAGHSRGGKQSFLAAIGDARVTAVAGIDPVDSAPPGFSNPADYPSVTPELMPQLRQPLAVLGTGKGGEGLFPCAPTDDNWRQYANAAPGSLVSWHLPNAGHVDFLDGCAASPSAFNCPLCSIGDEPAKAQAAAQAFLVAFFGATLRGERGYDAWLADPSADFPTLGVQVETRP